MEPHHNDLSATVTALIDAERQCAHHFAEYTAALDRCTQLERRLASQFAPYQVGTVEQGTHSLNQGRAFEVRSVGLAHTEQGWVFTAGGPLLTESGAVTSRTGAAFEAYAHAPVEAVREGNPRLQQAWEELMLAQKDFTDKHAAFYEAGKHYQTLTQDAAARFAPVPVGSVQVVNDPARPKRRFLVDRVQVISSQAGPQVIASGPLLDRNGQPLKGDTQRSRGSWQAPLAQQHA